MHVSLLLPLLSSVALFLLHFPSTATALDEYFLVNCGSDDNITAEYGRVFLSESNSPFLSPAGGTPIRDLSPSANPNPLYQTAKIFKTKSSYEFKINGNRTYGVRLHFFPFSSQGYNLSAAVFDVSVAGVSLSRDSKVEIDENVVLQECLLMVNGNKLVISFAPSPEKSPSVAFVSAIEVFSNHSLIRDAAYLVSATDGSERKGLLGNLFEPVYRINVGGPKTSDSLGRIWIPDDKFLAPPEAAQPVNYSGPIHNREGVIPDIAPENVSYAMFFKIAWSFGVPSASKYLIRLHFCDIVSSATNELYFNVYLNGYLAWKDLDLSNLTNQVLAAPYYADFIAHSDEKGLMHISLGCSEKNQFSKRGAILNGVEIMMMNGMISAHQGKRSVVLPFSLVFGSLFLVCALIAAILLAFKQKRESKDKDSPAKIPGQKISLAIIQLATNNFDESLLIGRGGFGHVYKGVLKNGMKVAVKRSTPGLRQGHSEFCTEIMIFSKIRHRHLVSLVGYCDEQSEMILVYEFMEKGMLRNHLYGTDGLPCLSWRQRLLICIGSARGLHYLHTGPALGIIHRDIKSANILLDENYVAKIADFGISRPVDCPDQSHVTTNVKGSFGYFDPQYFRSHHLTNKSDVYSFGVVLLEVLCARPAVDHSLPFERVNLANWAMQCLKGGLLEQITDPRIRDEMNADSLQKFGETAERCLAERTADRPTMAEVLWNLEYALKQQDMATNPAAPKEAIQPTFAFPMPTSPAVQNYLTGDSILSAPVPVKPSEGRIASSSESHMPTILRTW